MSEVRETKGITGNQLISAGSAQGPKFAAKVPESVRTPDKVHTELLGDLEFFDGMPSEETVRKVYDFLDFARGSEAFLNGIPAASVYAALEGYKEAGLNPGDLGIFEDLMDARSLFLTPNSTTVYGVTELDVKDGPVVAEIPPGVLGPVDDAFFRWITDIGMTGPDQGKGGKYLFVHRDYKGTLPEGYYVSRTPTYRNVLFFRAFVKDGDLKGTADALKAKYRMYPLAQAANPPRQRFLNLSGKQFNTIHSNDFKFYEELNAVIQHEPGDAFDPELVGLFASIGIKKGRPFSPDARMRKILAEAVAVGNATARALTFAPRKPSVYFYPDRKWTSAFAGGSYEFLDNGERVLDDRIFFHYYARHHPGDGGTESGHRLGLCGRCTRRGRPLSRWRQDLLRHAAQSHSGEQLLVVHGLFRAAPVDVGNRPEAGGTRQQQSFGQAEHRRFLYRVVRSKGSRRPRGQLDPDHARQKLQRGGAPLRPVAAVVRQDLEAR